MHCVLIWIALLTFSGCQPEATRPTADTIDTAPPSIISTETESASHSAEQSDREPAPQGILISDGLESIDWASLIGKQVTIDGDLVVVDTYDLVRRGQVNVARKRLHVPTSRIDPNDADPNQNSFQGGSNVAKVTKAQKFNENAILTLDDGSAQQNIFPPALFPGLGSTQATVRSGSVIKGVSGRIVKAGSKLLLVADLPLNWIPAERPQRPRVAQADVTVASFNVLNYFTTIDDGKNKARGADSNSEFKRQESKIVSAITELQADVVGLMELENSAEAEERLVAALNQSMGKNVFKGCGIPDGFRDAPGGKDAIRVGLIYRSDRVTPVGDVAMIRDEAFFIARTPVVQTFRSATGGKPFTVIVNHFKSKGSASRADEANKNKGDGQAAYNAARRKQSLAICNYVDAFKNDDEASRVLVIGDLNAYQQEDPIDALRANGLIDLHEKFTRQPSADENDGHYSYNYYGQSGRLDHAFATDSLAKDVTGIATWHINADEPRFLDYNQEYNPETLFQADPFRSSDHDPVLIGIRD
jgi:predicted extracellular nuclease